MPLETQMGEIEELKKTIQEHEDRISQLEKKLSTETIKSKPKKSNYSGPTGGVRMLIDNGFLDTPKFVSEIVDEMKREGYYHDLPTIDSALRKSFLKNKTLQRIKEGNKWKYVIRK